MNLERFRNKLIVFEGADLTGKTTIAKLFVDLLNSNNVPCIFTFQPGDTNYGTHATLMRSLCKDKRHNLHPLSNFFAFQLDRAEQTAKVVAPALEEGKTVISDRWNYSTIAYQLFGKQLLKEYDMPDDVLRWLNRTAIISRQPDVVFYFPDTLAVDRKDDPNDEFDNAADEFKQRVHNAYEQMAEAESFIRVAAKSSAEATLKHLLELY